jgi:transcriptional regulator with XRE-family HTH domain
MDQYKSLQDYLRQRLSAFDMTPAELSDEMGWGRSYIANILANQFRPSLRRCNQIAERFGDDPNIILSLAGYYNPPEDSDLLDEMKTSLMNLSPQSRKIAQFLIRALKRMEDAGDTLELEEE